MTSPIPLFDWKPIIPPSRSVSTSVGAPQRWSRRAAGPRTAVRLVLDGSEHADTLSHIRGCQNQHPALDRQHGIYRDTTDDVSKALGDIKTGDECPSQEQHGGGLLIGHVVSGIQVA